MRAEALRLTPLVLLLGCAGGPLGAGVAAAAPECWEAHFPVVPCATAERPESIGVWVFREASFVYDGCTVTYTHYRGPLDTWRFVWDSRGSRAIPLTVHGDPHPYYRARAEWDGDTLRAHGPFLRAYLGRWVGDHFVWTPERPLARARTRDELNATAREQLCARRIAPSTDELLREHGLDPNEAEVYGGGPRPERGDRSPRASRSSGRAAPVPPT